MPDPCVVRRLALEPDPIARRPGLASEPTRTGREPKTSQDDLGISQATPNREPHA